MRFRTRSNRRHAFWWRHDRSRHSTRFSRGDWADFWSILSFFVFSSPCPSLSFDAHSQEKRRKISPGVSPPYIMPPFTRFNMDVPRRPNLKDSAQNDSNIDRRKFLSATGGGLLAAAALPGIASAGSRDAGASAMPGFGGASVNAEGSNPARGQ